jgi:hypothetical protein
VYASFGQHPVIPKKESEREDYVYTDPDYPMEVYARS